MRKHIQIGNSGFSIMEVVAAIGAITVVILGALRVSGQMLKASAGAEAGQQRTYLQQEVTTIFSNADVCTSILGGLPSAEGTQVYLPESLKESDQTKNILSKVVLDRISLNNIVDLSGGLYKAVLNVTGKYKRSSDGTSEFTGQVPVFYSSSGGKITDCLSTRSPYSTCLALEGEWKNDSCDFCKSLGGSRLPSGVCSVAVAPPPPPPPVPPPSKDIVALRMASGYNGVRTRLIGTYKHCALTKSVYDGDGIGECTVTGTANGAWRITIGDEGTRNPQICYITCAYTGSLDLGLPQNGAYCNYGGKNGIMLNGCCATGSSWKRNYAVSGNGKNRTNRYVGLTNDIGCH